MPRANAAIVAVLIIAAVGGAVSAIYTNGGSEPSDVALDDIPPGYRRLYQEAAGDCPGLGWSILAAIGKIETDHGRSTLPGSRSGENAAGPGALSQD